MPRHPLVRFAGKKRAVKLAPFPCCAEECVLRLMPHPNDCLSKAAGASPWGILQQESLVTISRAGATV